MSQHFSKLKELPKNASRIPKPHTCLTWPRRWDFSIDSFLCTQILLNWKKISPKPVRGLNLSNTLLKMSSSKMVTS